MKKAALGTRAAPARNFQGGFTVLELLVVMVIIGLLVGYVGPRYFAQIGKSEIKATRAQIDGFGKALDQFRRRGGKLGQAQLRGFTLIEMLVVMAVIATLLSIAVPRYHASVEKSREAVLHQNLALLRETLDKYCGGKGKYPDALEDLVRANYLRRIPLDPVADSDSAWVSVPPLLPEMGGVSDVRSGVQGVASDGIAFQNW